MVALVSNSRAQHDGFAVLVILILIVAAGLAGHWYAQRSVDIPAKAEVRFGTSG
jgi:hypothetical protein